MSTVADKQLTNVPQQLTAAQRKVLWEQFVGVHAAVQEAFDSSVRTLAAAGVGATLTLATALHSVPESAVWAAGLFLGSLGSNFASYVSAQLDMGTRLRRLRAAAATYEGAEKTFWTHVTWLANFAAGVALVSGGLMLLLFIKHYAPHA